MLALLGHDPVGASPIRIAFLWVADKGRKNGSHYNICRVQHWDLPCGQQTPLRSLPNARLVDKVELCVDLAKRRFHPSFSSNAHLSWTLALRRLRLWVERCNIRGALRHFYCIHAEQLGDTFETLGDLARDFGAGS